MSGLLSSKYEENSIPELCSKIKLFYNDFGADKFLFGTDFPVQTHEHSVKLIIEDSIGDVASQEDLNKIFRGNALKIFDNLL